MNPFAWSNRKEISPAKVLSPAKVSDPLVICSGAWSELFPKSGASRTACPGDQRRRLPAIEKAENFANWNEEKLPFRGRLRATLCDLLSKRLARDRPSSQPEACQFCWLLWHFKCFSFCSFPQNVSKSHLADFDRCGQFSSRHFQEYI